MSKKRELMERIAAKLRLGLGTGYVLDIGPRFFLLALVDERVRFNGFQCLRLQDVRGLRIPAPYAAFREAAIAIRGERVPDKPQVCLDSIEQILWTAKCAFPSGLRSSRASRPDCL